MGCGDYSFDSCYFTAHKVKAGKKAHKPKNPLSPVCYLSLTSACDECWRRGVVGVAAYWKSKVILTIKNVVNPPKNHASTHIATAHGGNGDVISQTTGQIHAPEPAAWPQVTQPPISDALLICFSTQPISDGSSFALQPDEIAENKVLHQVKQKHCLHSISDSCNLIEHLITIFA